MVLETAIFTAIFSATELTFHADQLRLHALSPLPSSIALASPHARQHRVHHNMQTARARAHRLVTSGMIFSHENLTTPLLDRMTACMRDDTGAGHVLVNFHGFHLLDSCSAHRPTSHLWNYASIYGRNRPRLTCLILAVVTHLCASPMRCFRRAITCSAQCLDQPSIGTTGHTHPVYAV